MNRNTSRVRPFSLHAFFALCVLAFDASIQFVLLSRGFEWRDAQLVGAGTLLVSYLVLRHFVFRLSDRGRALLNGSPPWWWLALIACMALSLRGVVGQLYLGDYPQWSVVAASVATTAAVLACGVSAFPKVAFPGAREILEQSAAFLVFALCATRLLYSGQLELLSQEAYYWKYAENLSYGYLDHPPAVALLITIGQALFGVNELGVRVLALVCWCVMALFVVLLATEWFGRGVARGTLVLLAILPFFTGVGFYMTPDTPLVVCWSAALFFLHRAVLRQQSWAWYLVGLSIGFGMLAKYPMVLLGPGIFAFLLLDRDSRKWFWSPQPYSAAILAFLIFSPVLFWNQQHEWASFTFQGARRFEAASEFSVHMFLAFFLLLLTPIGAYWMFVFALPAKFRSRFALAENFNLNRRVRLFVLALAGAPLLMFLYASFTQELKVNWLGPALLVCVPVLALAFQRKSSGVRSADRSLAWVQRGWLATVILIVGGLHLFLFILGVGWSTLHYPSSFKKFLGREALAAEVRRVEQETFQLTGIVPVVMGADSHYVGSLVGFYRAKQAADTGAAVPLPTQGRYLLGGAYSLMYQFWSHVDHTQGHPVVMVSRTKSDVDDQATEEFFESLGPIEEFVPQINGRKLGSYFIRVGYEYRGF